MSISLNPYLNFRDTTKEVMEFYHSIFGGTLESSTFGEFHASDNPTEQDKIMHSVLKGDNDVTFMAADTPNRMELSPTSNISMSLSGTDEAALNTYFEKLSDGGTIGEPLTKAPWGDTFGMLTDKYGVTWLVNILTNK